ncbi:MAG: LysM peptidoglycan-binding domain-containing protein [Chitinophagaceae bacterium]|nr:LysM peptidoglycan-binding domain-containing protein [Oligoflexus sp.]
MKRSLVKLFGITYLFAATHLMTVSCASSDEGAGDEVTSEDGNAADADGANNAENANGANNEDGANGGNNFGNNEGNAAAGGKNEFGNQADGGAGAGAEGAVAEGGAPAGGGDENLQQIIEEMNSANPAAPAAQGSAEQGFDNLAKNATPEGAASAAAPVGKGAPATGAPAAPGLPELGSKMAYVVQKGDTLAKIATRIYGEANKWAEIADFTGIANPKLIYPGDVVYYQLTEKTATFATAYEGVGRSEVEVAQGDTLATIANKVFHNSSLWKMIWRQNDKIDNPDKLIPGTKVYYIDQAKLADLNKEVSSKVASIKVENKSKANKVVKSEVSKSKKSAEVKAKSTKSIEVANDQVVDQFSHLNAHNLVARLI